MIDLSGSDVIDNDYGVIPEGEYPAVVDKVEWRDSWDKTRTELNYQIRLVGNKYANRVLFKKFDINSPDDDIKKKAKNSLKKMTTAFGLTADKFEENSIVGKNVNVVVSVYETKEKVERNSIFYFKPFKDLSKKASNSVASSIMKGESLNIESNQEFKGDSIPF